MDFHGDHTRTCTAHSGATKAHDWMVSVLGPVCRTRLPNCPGCCFRCLAGNTVRTQMGVTGSAGQRCGPFNLRDQAGSRNLVFDLAVTHERFGSSSHPQQNGLLTHHIDAPLRVAAQRKIQSCRQQYAANHNISSLPAIFSTFTRMHGEFWRLRFLQAHRETEAHCTSTGMPSQRNNSDMFVFRRAAFYQTLKSKVGLAAAKAAAVAD